MSGCKGSNVTTHPWVTNTRRHGGPTPSRPGPGPCAVPFEPDGPGPGPEPGLGPGLWPGLGPGCVVLTDIFCFALTGTGGSFLFLFSGTAELCDAAPVSR